LTAELRTELLKLISDPNVRQRLSGIAGDAEFLAEVAWQYRLETAPAITEVLKVPQATESVLQKSSLATLNAILGIASFRIGATDFAAMPGAGPSLALASQANAEVYASFLFLTDTTSNPQLFGWVMGWLHQVRQAYPESFRIRYVLGSLLYFFEGKALPQGLCPQKLVRDALRAEPEPTIAFCRTYVEQRVEYRRRFPDLMSLVSNLPEMSQVFPDLPAESRIDALNSVYVAVLAEQYQILSEVDLSGGLRKGASWSRLSDEAIGQALRLWKKNPYALCLQGYAVASERAENGLLKAREIFTQADKLADKLRGGWRFLRAKTKANVYLGLSFVLQKRGLIQPALDYCKAAWDVAPEPLYRVIVLINRAKCLLELGELEESRGTLEQATGMIPEVEADGLDENGLKARIFVNLGLVFYLKGLSKDAEQKYLQAIALDDYLAEAYNNLASVYADQKKTDNARKLLETATRLDPGLTEARSNLACLKQGEASDWWDWWFAAASPLVRRIAGATLGGALAAELGRCVYTSFRNEVVPTSTLITMGIIGLILILPWIRKLEVGPVKLETESKGQSPVG
jgi:tetratricopeptide (TPR) repeat protein